MLHRGKYGDGDTLEQEKFSWQPRKIFGRLIGIDANYTCGDKIIAWSVFVYAFIYEFGLMFVGVIVWNFFYEWPTSWWGVYFLIFCLIVPSIVAAVSTVWFVIGGLIDLCLMLRALAERFDNPLDNGRVEGHVSVVDQESFDMLKEKRVMLDHK